MSRDRQPTFSEVEQLVDSRLEPERKIREITYEWLSSRLQAVERKVVFWGAVPSLLVGAGLMVEFWLRSR